MREVREAFERAENPALWCSFGKDSLLLLRLALDAGFNGPIYYFGDELNALARQVILDHDLTVFSWPCADRYLVPNGGELAQVDEYVVGRTVVPFVSPVVKGDNCNHGSYKSFRRTFTYPHDITLTGYKQGETCAAVGVTFEREVDIGMTRLVNPLYDWTDEQVVEALGFTPPDDNAVEYCDECLAFIESSNWDRDAALARFRSRFNFN